jgi:hypothetical protein
MTMLSALGALVRFPCLVLQLQVASINTELVALLAPKHPQLLVHEAQRRVPAPNGAGYVAETLAALPAD